MRKKLRQDGPNLRRHAMSCLRARYTPAKTPTRPPMMSPNSNLTTFASHNVQRAAERSLRYVNGMHSAHKTPKVVVAHPVRRHDFLKGHSMNRGFELDLQVTFQNPAKCTKEDLAGYFEQSAPDGQGKHRHSFLFSGPSSRYCTPGLQSLWILCSGRWHPVLPSSDTSPPVHNLHMISPLMSWYCPSGHTRHSPGWAEPPYPYLPRSQLLQIVEPFTNVVSPIAQRWQDVKSAVSSWRCQPFGHSTQPDPKPYIPGLHLLQRIDPLPLARRPTAQIWQVTLADALANIPGLHLSQIALRGRSENLPGIHD